MLKDPFGHHPWITESSIMLLTYWASLSDNPCSKTINCLKPPNSAGQRKTPDTWQNVSCKCVLVSIQNLTAKFHLCPMNDKLFHPLGVLTRYETPNGSLALRPIRPLYHCVWVSCTVLQNGREKRPQNKSPQSGKYLDESPIWQNR